MKKQDAFDLIAQAIEQGGFLRYRKNYSPLKWRFLHPRHRPIVFWGKTALAAVEQFVRAERNWKAKRKSKPQEAA